MAPVPLFSAHGWIITMVAKTKQKPIQEDHSVRKFMIFREFQLKQQLGKAAGYFSTCQRDERAKWR